MAKLRHVAVVVRDLEKATRFYEQIFDMKRAFEVKNTAVYLTDGTMNLALLNYDVVNRARLEDRGRAASASTISASASPT